MKKGQVKGCKVLVFGHLLFPPLKRADLMPLPCLCIGANGKKNANSERNLTYGDNHGPGN